MCPNQSATTGTGTPDAKASGSIFHRLLWPFFVVVRAVDAFGHACQGFSKAGGQDSCASRAGYGSVANVHFSCGRKSGAGVD